MCESRRRYSDEAGHKNCYGFVAESWESAGREMTRWDLVASHHPSNTVAAISRYGPHRLDSLWPAFCRKPSAGMVFEPTALL